MRKISLVTIVLAVCQVFLSLDVKAQMYRGKSGVASIFSATLLEDTEAKSSQLSSVFNPLTGDVIVVIPTRSFKFQKPLMQEHFNQVCLKSEKFPEVTFVGSVQGKFEEPKGDKKTAVNVSGKLKIHGVVRDLDLQIIFSAPERGSLIANGKFKINLMDHGIKIPQLGFGNITEIVDVFVNLRLEENNLNISDSFLLLDKMPFFKKLNVIFEAAFKNPVERLQQHFSQYQTLR